MQVSSCSWFEAPAVVMFEVVILVMVLFMLVLPPLLQLRMVLMNVK